MRLVRDTRYAIDALAVLAGRPEGSFVHAKEIADEAGLPVAYLHKILRRLTTAGIVRTRPGVGSALAKPPDQTTVAQILAALGGSDAFEDRCIFWREACSADDPCPLHFRWIDVRPAVEDAIGSTTLADVAAASTTG